VNVKKYKPTASPRSHDKLLAKTVERSEANIRIARGLLADCRRTYDRAQEVIARSNKLKEQFSKPKS
jgi:hypothetical protein